MSELSSELGVIPADRCESVAEQCEIVVSSVKPQQYEEVIESIKIILRKSASLCLLHPRAIKAICRVVLILT